MGRGRIYKVEAKKNELVIAMKKNGLYPTNLGIVASNEDVEKIMEKERSEMMLFS